MCGLLAACRTPDELPDALAQAVSAYIESEFIPLTAVRERMGDVVDEVMAWANAVGAN